MELGRLPLTLIALCLFTAQAFFAYHSTVAPENKFFAPPPQQVEYFTFGFSLAMADSYWLRWVQDGDYCQVYGKQSTAVAEPTEEEKNNWLYNPQHKACDNSWSFLMLDAITKLDPRFKMAYTSGTIFLTVLTEDYSGATILLERGMKQFPDDWQMAYRAAYHYLFDLHDLTRAAEMAVHASELGAPPWLQSLAARIYSQQGQLQLGITALENYKKNLTDEAQIAKIDARLKELREHAAREEKGP